MNWTLETRKSGAEIYVTSDDHSIFIGEGYSDEEERKSLCIAHIIVRALNEHYEEV
tara:strand:+ start:1495 stop:1662 length:168 start_codon:yes stop_codon:yes gene_type:complete